MNHRTKILGTIAASYAVICVAVAICLGLVTSQYERAVEQNEFDEIKSIVSRQLKDIIWTRHAEVIISLAGQIAQERKLRRFTKQKDLSKLSASLSELKRRAATSMGDVRLLGVDVFDPSGVKIAQNGDVSVMPPDWDIGGMLGARRGIARAKIVTHTWNKEGLPILTVVHPIGGLRPIGYLAIHSDLLHPTRLYEKQFGMGIAFKSPDGTRLLRRASHTKDGDHHHHHQIAFQVAAPNGKAAFVVEVTHYVDERTATMDAIRHWSYVSLLGALLCVALISGGLLLRLTRWMANDEASSRAKLAMDQMPQGVCLFDKDNNLIVCNKRYIEIFDLPPQLGQPGTPFKKILEHRIRSGLYPSSSPEVDMQQQMARVKGREPYTLVQELVDGRSISISFSPLTDGGWIGTIEDISDRLRVESQIVHMAHHDLLTDLPNRGLLRERLQQLIDGNRQNDQRFALFMLDLDRFKEINDTMGHPAGDVLLQHVAGRLRSVIRETDTVARFGGDEFAVLQTQLISDVEAESLARRITETISEPYDIDGQHFEIGASIGITISPKDGSEPDELFKNADLALYRAKQDGRGTYQFFEPGLDKLMRARRKLERDLRHAVVNEDFVLFYQPLVDLDTDEVCCFEALLRWRKQDGGIVTPDKFIPVAEETGLIVQMGEWVLRTACAEAVNWPENVQVAVNVSALQFKSKNFIPSVIGALELSGLSPERLELEVTESVILDDGNEALDMLTQLKELGVKLALDDFGTGFSSLTSLHRFPFNKIKIDKSFVNDLSSQDAKAVSIVRSVAGLGGGLGMSTTAEGVETQEQLEQVRSLGCTEIQGYYISRPKPADQVAEIIKGRHNEETEAA